MPQHGFSKRTVSAYVMTSVLLCVSTGQGSLVAQGTQDVAEWLHSSSEWGWDVTALNRAYPFEEDLISVLTGVTQDLDVGVFGHPAILGFFFGDEGLYRIVASLHFGDLKEEQVLAKSEGILAAITNMYGAPDVAHPWNGQYFAYWWRLSKTMILFARDASAGSSWGVHLHSRDLDADIVRHYERTVF